MPKICKVFLRSFSPAMQGVNEWLSGRGWCKATSPEQVPPIFKPVGLFRLYQEGGGRKPSANIKADASQKYLD